MIALIPHIVRSPSITPLDLRGISAGTDQTVKLTYAPEQPPAAPVAPSVPPAAPSPAPASSGPPAVAFVPPATVATLGGQVVVTMNAQNVTDLFAASPIRVQWDPRLLRLI